MQVVRSEVPASTSATRGEDSSHQNSVDWLQKGDTEESRACCSRKTALEAIAELDLKEGGGINFTDLWGLMSCRRDPGCKTR
jgi:hypothetical protein